MAVAAAGNFQLLNSVGGEGGKEGGKKSKKKRKDDSRHRARLPLSLSFSLSHTLLFYLENLGLERMHLKLRDCSQPERRMRLVGW